MGGRSAKKKGKEKKRRRRRLLFLLRPPSPPPLFPRGESGGIGKLFVVLVALAHIDSKLHEPLTMPCCNPAKNAVFSIKKDKACSC